MIRKPAVSSSLTLPAGSGSTSLDIVNHAANQSGSLSIICSRSALISHSLKHIEMSIRSIQQRSRSVKLSVSAGKRWRSCSGSSLKLMPGTDLTVVDTIPDDTDIGEQAAAAADREALWKIVDSLDYQKRTVIRLHFYDDHDLTKISKRLGMSIQNVSRIKKDAIRILRKKEAIRNLAMDYGYSGAYKGSLQSFRNSGMSCVERIALKNVSIEEQRKKIFSELANLKIAYQKGGENENE